MVPWLWWRVDGDVMVSRCGKSTLYQPIMATALCMKSSEREKRHTHSYTYFYKQGNAVWGAA
jgi:hypothetical protein